MLKRFYWIYVYYLFFSSYAFAEPDVTRTVLIPPSIEYELAVSGVYKTANSGKLYVYGIDVDNKTNGIVLEGKLDWLDECNRYALLAKTSEKLRFVAAYGEPGLPAPFKNANEAKASSGKIWACGLSECT